MVAIDFEDGSAALVSGIDDTFMELGLTRDVPEPVEASSSLADVMPESELPTAGASMVIHASTLVTTTTASSSSISTKSSAPSQVEANNRTTATTTSVSKVTKPMKPSYLDARDRMRAQAETKQANSNPWWTVATYLAQKAKESIIANQKEDN